MKGLTLVLDAQFQTPVLLSAFVKTGGAGATWAQPDCSLMTLPLAHREALESHYYWAAVDAIGSPSAWLMLFCVLCARLLWLRRQKPLPGATRSASSSEQLAPFERIGEVDQAMQGLQCHVDEDRWIHAGTTVGRLRATTAAPTQSLARAAQNALSRIDNADLLMKRYIEATTALSMIVGEDPAWILMTSAADGTQTFMRREEGLLWTKVRARMAVPMAHTLAVCREAELYKSWYPMCISSGILKNINETEMIFRIENCYAMPLVTVREDFIVHTYLVDCAQEHSGLLACGQSPREAAWPDTPFPPRPEGRYAIRTHVDALQFFCEPDGDEACNVTLQMAIKDPGAPEWLLRFIFSKVLARLFSALAESAAAIHMRPQSSPHTKAMASKPRLYQQVLPKMIAACMASQDAPRGRAELDDGPKSQTPQTMAEYMAEVRGRERGSLPRWLTCCLPK